MSQLSIVEGCVIIYILGSLIRNYIQVFAGNKANAVMQLLGVNRMLGAIMHRLLRHLFRGEVKSNIYLYKIP
jgi:hypothetical protein